jgi:hypothetical protein
MIFEQIVQEVCERLNLTSDEAKSRVGREVNSRYRRLTSSIGLETSRRVEISQTATIGNRTITFHGIEKVIAIIDKTSGEQDVVLSQISFDEMHITPLRTQPPRHYAITNIHANSVDIYMDCIPSTQFLLYADGHTTVSTLTGPDSPDFPESFHDVLVFGAMADEYRKMEKLPYAQAAELDYEKRLSDLRMWIAKTAYYDQYQGRYTGKTFRWTRDAQLLWDS